MRDETDFKQILVGMADSQTRKEEKSSCGRK
jgi:hypothetical protein